MTQKPGGPRSTAAGIAAMPRESRQEALAKGIATAENQLSGIAQTLKDRREAELRGSITLGKDGRVHAVLIPTRPFKISGTISDALIHIVVNPMANREMMSIHTVEAVQKAVIEVEHDAGFPIPERAVSTDVKRHSAVKKVATDTRRESFGNGMISADLLADHVMNTLHPGWRQYVRDAA
jgi:hypothetical protein